MNDLMPFVEQIRRAASEHASPEMLSSVVMVAAGLLVGGLFLCVFGAKLARFGLTATFVLAGGLTGLWFARTTGFLPVACVPLGALMFAAIGFVTFRFWAGALLALTLASLAMGVFGYQRVAPHATAFNMVSLTPVSGASELAVAAVSTSGAATERTPAEWGTQFWSFATQRDANLANHGRALLLATVVTGLCIGILALRWMLILSTSLIGTSFVATGAATLLSRAMPSTEGALLNHPLLLTAGVGVLCLASLIVQTRLTRPAEAAKPGQASSDKA